jgi:hypothetical protein
MGLVVGEDSVGVWVAIDCDHGGCGEHVAVRPAGEGWTRLDLIYTAGDMATDAGWLLRGGTWCQRHTGHGPRARGTVGDGRSWTAVTSEAVKGAKRRSGPLTAG